jgi:hypothetical protein
MFHRFPVPEDALFDRQQVRVYSHASDPLEAVLDEMRHR